MIFALRNFSFGPVTIEPGEPDPFAYESEREDEFVARATAGHSHVLYEKSPGGVREMPPQVRDDAEASVKRDTIPLLIAAAGVNRPDVLQRLGTYPVPPGASDIPGLEVAGVGPHPPALDGFVPVGAADREVDRVASLRPEALLRRIGRKHAGRHRRCTAAS